jgi:hypothetical protein
MDISENIFKQYKGTNRRISKRIPYSEKSFFYVIGSIDILNCSTDECISAKVKNFTEKSIILLTDYHLKPGTLIRFKDPSSQIQTAIVMWSLTHQTSYESEALFL